MWSPYFAERATVGPQWKSENLLHQPREVFLAADNDWPRSLYAEEVPREGIVISIMQTSTTQLLAASPRNIRSKNRGLSPLQSMAWYAGLKEQTRRQKFVSITHASEHLSGQSTKEISISSWGWAIMVVDGAQSTPHMAIDVPRLRCRFLFAFSGHVICNQQGLVSPWKGRNIRPKMSPDRVLGHLAYLSVALGRNYLGNLKLEQYGGAGLGAARLLRRA